MKRGIVVPLPGRIHTLVKGKPDGKETSKQSVKKKVTKGTGDGTVCWCVGERVC